MIHLDFLFETNSLTDKAKYAEMRSEYEILSKRINKFTQYVEENWNEFQEP